MENNVYASQGLRGMLKRVGESVAISNVDLMPTRLGRGSEEVSAWLAPVDSNDVVVAGKVNSQCGSEKTGGSGNEDHLLIHFQTCRSQGHVSIGCRTIIASAAGPASQIRLKAPPDS